jgi:hypothetical protein
MLGATVGMMNQSRFGLAMPDRHGQCITDQLRFQSWIP